MEIQHIQRKVSEYLAAVNGGEFTAASLIRDQLEEMGVILKHCDAGVSWKLKGIDFLHSGLELNKEELPQPPAVSVENCNFAGVHFDEAATEAVMVIAEGLVENAKALGELASVLKASNVEIETLIRFPSLDV